MKTREEVITLFRAKYDYLKSVYPEVGSFDEAASTNFYQNPDGGWQLNLPPCAAITLRPGADEAHEVHGSICERWYKEGGTQGLLGYPLTDEESFGPNNLCSRKTRFEKGSIDYDPSTYKTSVQMGLLIAANDFLKRMIAYILHAIWGIVRRIGHVIRWLALRLYDFANWFWRLLIDIVKFFFSIRFLMFLVLLVVLVVVCAVFTGIIVAPFFLLIWFAQGTPLATTKCLMATPFCAAIRIVWKTMCDWLLGIGVNDGVYRFAWIIEGVWLVLFAGWGTWKGVQSYKRGVIARWRERRRLRKAERRARKAEQRAAKDAARWSKRQR